MSFSGIQATVDFYTFQENVLTNELTDILTKITLAARKTSDIADATTQQREAVKAQYSDSSSTEYKNAMADIEDNYELQISQISAWESELETQKQSKETEVQATRSYAESFKSALKENVQKSFKYGGQS